MDDLLVLLFAAVALIGAVSAHLQRDRFDKLIAVGITFGGIAPFIAARGYLDVLIAVSLIVPVTTIIILLICGRDAHDA